MARDYYEVLGIEKNASADEIKRAFRKKARELHPDVNKAQDAEEKFKELGQAYEVLSDTEKRSMYDRYGEDGLKNAGFDTSGPFDFGFGDLNDIFASFFGGGFTSSQRKRDPNAPQRGSDLRLDLDITFEEAVFGTEKDVEIEHLENCDACSGSGIEKGHHPETCSTCRGAGRVQTSTQTILGSFTQVSTCPTCGGSGKVIKNPCKKCAGKGRVSSSKTINIKIPKGIDNHNKLRMSGEGDAGKNGGPAGDLYVIIYVKEHEKFQRDGTNIYTEEDITFSQAALGDEIEVETVDGLKILKIPNGIQSGTILSIKGVGIPFLSSTSRRGDQFIKINVETPTALNEEEKKLYIRLMEIQKNKPNKKGIINKVKDAFSGVSL
ncbi:MAG: molecular chaperone DnaJ [Candidatus Gastranaerophilales bacterium]|nr:molecular chaperone DnaJ [Candidatus Gastranaerophilales bacterium]